MNRRQPCCVAHLQIVFYPYGVTGHQPFCCCKLADCVLPIRSDWSPAILLLQTCRSCSTDTKLPVVGHSVAANLQVTFYQYGVTSRQPCSCCKHADFHNYPNNME